MLLVIDIGNTNVSLGVFDYGIEDPQARLAHHWRISTHHEQTSDELGITLRSLFQLEGLAVEAITDVIVSSVVPPLQPIWDRVSTKLFDRPPVIVGPGIRTGMPVRYENPHEVGADRIVNAVAAYDLFRSSTIVVDFGTATTFDCISSAGEYLGGSIFPGIHVSMDALFDRASKLHRIEHPPPRAT